MSNGGEVVIKITGDDSEYEAKLNGLGAKAKLHMADVKAGLDLVSAAVEKIASVAKKGVDYNAKMESYRTSFEVMTGSAEKAAEVVERLRKMGAETPFETTDLVQTTQLLMQYGFTADDAISKMSMLGDIAQGNQEAMNSIALGYAQMSSAGKVNLQDIKQMINGGFNPLQEISERTGESMASLYDRISKGTMSIDEITQSMASATSEGGKFYQSMEKQSQTLSGQLATLQDNANELLGSMTSGLSESLSSKVLPMVNNIIGELQGAFDKNGFQGLLDSATDMIPDLIGMMTGKLDDAMDGLLRWAPKLADALTESLPSVVSGLSSAIPTLTTALFEVASNVVSGLITMLPELVPELAEGIFNTVSAAFAGLDSLVGGLFDGIHKALVKIGADIPYVGESVQKMLDSVSQVEIDDIVKNADVDFDISVSADDVIAEVKTAKTTIEEKLAEIDGIDASKIANAIIAGDGTDVLNAALVNIGVSEKKADEAVATINAAQSKISTALDGLGLTEEQKTILQTMTGEGASDNEIVEYLRDTCGVPEGKATEVAGTITEAQTTISDAINGLDIESVITKHLQSMVKEGATSNEIEDYLKQFNVDAGTASAVAASITTGGKDVSTAISGLGIGITASTWLASAAASGDKALIESALQMMGLDDVDISGVLESYESVRGKLAAGIGAIFDNIEDTLTDGKEDTPEQMNGLKAQVEEWAREAYEKIEKWYNDELKRLAQENAEGKTTESEYNEKVAALKQKADDLRAAVDKSVTDTSNFITSMAGETTKNVKKHLTELEELATTAEEVAAQIDALSPQQKDHGEVSRTLTITGVTQDKSTQFEAIALTYKEYAEMIRAAEEEYAAAIEDARKNKSGAEYAEAETAAKNVLNDAKQQAADYYQNYMRQILAGIAESDPKLSGQIDDIISRQKMGDMMTKLRERLEEEFTNYQVTGESTITVADILGELNISDEDIAAWAQEFGIAPEMLMQQFEESLEIGDTGFSSEIGAFTTKIGDDLKTALNDNEMDLSSVVPSLVAAIQEGYLIPGINGVDYTAGGDLFNELLAGAMTVSDSTKNTGLTAQLQSSLDAATSGLTVDMSSAVDSTAQGAEEIVDAADKSKEMKDIGDQTGKGFYNGVVPKIRSAVSTVGSILNGLPPLAKKILQINSPSRIMRNIGKSVGEGFDLGVRESMETAVQTAKRMTGKLITVSDITQSTRVNVPNLNQEIKLANEQSSVPVNLDGQRIAEIQGLNNATRIEFLRRQEAKGYGL